MSIPVDTTRTLAGITRAEDLLLRVRAEPDRVVTVGVLGPGGCHKSALLRCLGDMWRAAGSTVLDARRFEDGHRPEPGTVVVIDDAHALDAAVLQDLADVVTARTNSVAVAFRPWPRPAPLTTVASLLRERGPLTVLQHLHRSEVARRAQALAGRPLPDAVLDVVMEQTCGLPLVLDEVIAALAESELDGPARTGRLPDDLVDRLRFAVDDLEPGTRTLLHAVAAGAAVETGVLAALLGREPAHVREGIDQARATGYLLGNGRLVPLFRQVLLDTEPQQRTREFQLELLDIHPRFEHDAVPVARALTRTGSRSVRAATVLASAAHRQMQIDPTVAVSLFREAASAGPQDPHASAAHAEAAALCGQFDVALKLADPLLADPQSGAAAQATEVAATVLARQGQWGRAAELYSWLGVERAAADVPVAALTFLAAGQPEPAAEMLDQPVGHRLPTMLPRVKDLMVEGVRLSLTDATTEALSALSRAASMLEPLGSWVLLPDTPAALGAVISIHAGEFRFAESMLRRALAGGNGGERARARHLLLMAWIAMLRGQLTSARSLACEAAATSRALDFRDEFLLESLRVGIARRSGDQSELSATWHAAREIVVRQDVDLFMIAPLSELALGAHRCGEPQWVAEQVNRSWALLAAVGTPGLWSTPLLWASALMDVADRQVDRARKRATALRAAPAPYAGVLASAVDAWLQLDNPEDCAEAVHGSATALHGAGLSWDAAQLLSTAANGCKDRRAAATFLQAARAMHGGGAVPEPDGPAATADPTVVVPTRTSMTPASSPADGTAGVLSGRELEIGRLLLLNMTYRQIGEKLFISPKTVEHHVARIKQRLGAGDRSELFAELRSLTASPELALR